ncbi:MAG: hypothetical protein EA381_05765 [Planctomycetaceae bacterium]|nr:MAG: hypothetical protein EA381_05765 [Planctomycetaceae bacterium]
MRLPKPWTKKRGGRLLGGANFSGAVGEAMLLFACSLAGVFTLALVSFRRFASASLRESTGLPEGFISEDAFSSDLGFWIVLVLGCALLVIGGGGLAYRLVRIGASDERRSVMATRATAIAPALPAEADWGPLPNVPPGRGLTDSPGMVESYRLASEGSPRARTVAASACLALLWNGTWFVLLAIVISGFVHQSPRWVLGFLLFPFAGIGWWAFRHFLDNLKRTAGLGATIVEISDHPLQPGSRYTLFVRQAGRLQLRRLRIELVCDEESSYLQGTDLRIDRHRAYDEILHTERDLAIDPDHPWERQLRVTLPADAMHSFRSPHNAVCWKITVSGEARPWPSFCQSFPVVVHPSTGPPIRHPR